MTSATSGRARRVCINELLLVGVAAARCSRSLSRRAAKAASATGAVWKSFSADSSSGGRMMLSIFGLPFFAQKIEGAVDAHLDGRFLAAFQRGNLGKTQPGREAQAQEFLF